MAKTNIEVVRCSDYVHKDSKGFFIYVGLKARPVTQTGLKFYVDEEFEPHVRSLYKEEA